MALTPPTILELEAFRHEAFTDGSPEETWAADALQQATDALWVATGLEEYPADSRASRIARYAIMDLALWLLAQADHRDEINSPFSGERIGSYSYQKMQQAQRGEESGIYWLDMFFRLLRQPAQESEGHWVHSERVFDPEGHTYAEQQVHDKIKMLDPPEPWGFN